jgi:hypothetical protein
MKTRVALGSFAVLVALGLWSMPSDTAPAPEPDAPEPAQPTERVADRTSAQTPAEVAPEVRAAYLPEPTASPPPARPTWAQDRVMVAGTSEALRAVAGRYGVEVLREPGPGGIGALGLPRGITPARFAATLEADPEVGWAGKVGLMHGASNGNGGSLRQYQWHLDSVDTRGSLRSTGIVIAVLDTGVAYENHADASGQYRKASSLASVPIVAPYDFVNDDAHPNDDHQHGTHIASIIVANGQVHGVARGATLMPVKVLDSNNVGTEIDLIDGLAHAVANGADIVNMSLSFELDYVLSGPLGNALQAAHDAGVVLVAAAGNEGAPRVTYPAAYPPVIGVVASQCDDLAGCGDVDDYVVAPYSNRGPGADVIAPGGSLSVDGDGDGVPDGILAETLDGSSDGGTSWFLMAGTSQATAVVSGAAAHLLASGADPNGIVAPLRYTARGGDPDASWRDYDVVATPQVQTAVDNLASWQPNHDPVHMTLMPYLADNGGGQVSPHFRVQALDADGSPLPHAMVYGTLLGGDEGLAHCMTNHQGVCTIDGHALAMTDRTAWALSVDAVVDRNWNLRSPTLALFARDGLEAVVDQMDDGTVLGFSWEGRHYDGLGTVAEAYVALNNGSGLTSSPFGVIMPSDNLARLATVTLGSLSFAEPVPWCDEDRTSLTTVTADFGGTGLTSSPFGFVPMHPPLFDGTPDGSVRFGAWNPVSISSTNPVARSAEMGTNLLGTQLGARLSSGGWMDGSGVQPAAALVGPDGLDIAPSPGATEGSGAGAMPFVRPRGSDSLRSSDFDFDDFDDFELDFDDDD